MSHECIYRIELEACVVTLLVSDSGVMSFHPWLIDIPVRVRAHKYEATALQVKVAGRISGIVRCSAL